MMRPCLKQGELLQKPSMNMALMQLLRPVRISPLCLDSGRLPETHGVLFRVALAVRGQEYGPFDPSGRLREDEDDDGNDGAASHHEDAWSQWYQDHDWYRNSWWDSSAQWWNWQQWPQDRPQHQPSSAGKYDVSLAASDEADKFLPDFVVAWMLLQRSGLDGTERGAIIANLKNQFTTSRVKEALRLNWPEEDLRKRDQAKGSALLVDEDFDDALLHEEEEVDLESLDDESREEYGYLIKNVESAFQAFQGARRTLKEAREKQSVPKEPSVLSYEKRVGDQSQK